MADKNKNKKENEEYESDGSVVVYKVDNSRGKGKVSGKDGESTYFVRKVTDERWETNLPEPLWLADMLQDGYRAKPPCRDFAIDPFDVISMVRGMLPSDDNECVVIYEDDDENNDINKFKKGNKMRKYDFFRNGGRYIPYVNRGRKIGYYQNPTDPIEEEDEGQELGNRQVKSFKVTDGFPEVFYLFDNSNGDMFPIYWDINSNYAYIKNENTGEKQKIKLKDENLKTRIRNNGMSDEMDKYQGSAKAYLNLMNPNDGYFNAKGEWVLHDVFLDRLAKDPQYQQLSNLGSELLSQKAKAYERNDYNAASSLSQEYFNNVLPQLTKLYNKIGLAVSVNPSAYKQLGGRFQRGGGFRARRQQDEQMQQLQALVQAALSGDQKAQEMISQIAQAAEGGDTQAQQIYAVIQQIVQEIQGAQSARMGGRFNYVHQLRTGVMPHKNIVFNRKGGRLVRSVVDSRRAGGRLQAPRRNYINYFG